MKQSPLYLPCLLRRPLLWAVVMLALGGLFAMHALGTHGAASHAAMTAGAVESPTMAPSAATDAHLGEAIAPSRTEPALAGATPAPGTSHGLLDLCVAMMGGLALAALLRWLGRRARPTAASGAPRTPLLVRAGRERDPPCLARLSVMRC